METVAHSTSVFILSNETKQLTLGVGLGVPIGISEGFNIPGNMEELPQCPAHFILGIDRLNHAHTIINITLTTLTFAYKHRTVTTPLNYLHQDNIVASYSESVKHDLQGFKYISSTASNQIHYIPKRNDRRRRG